MSLKFKGDSSTCVSMHRRPRRVGIETGKGLTEQAHKDSCNVNLIIKRYKQTGQLPPVRAVPQFGDVSNIPDFQSAMNTVAHAQSAFAALPAAVRAKYKNDPQLYIEGLKAEVEKVREDKRIKKENDDKIKQAVKNVKDSPPPKPE